MVLALMFGVEILIANAFYDVGIRYKSGDPRGIVINLFGVGIAVSLLLSYKGLGYRALFNPGGIHPVRTVSPLIAPILLMTCGSVILVGEILNLLLYVAPTSPAEMEANARLIGGGVISLVGLTLIAPFIEEMLFRGLFLRSFLTCYTPVTAVILSSLLFGAFHLNLPQFVVGATLGVISGLLYLWTRSLWPCVLEHAIYNGAVWGYVQAYPETLEIGLPEPVPIHSAPVLIGGCAAFGVGLLWLSQRARKIGAYAP